MATIISFWPALAGGAATMLLAFAVQGEAIAQAPAGILQAPYLPEVPLVKKAGLFDIFKTRKTPPPRKSQPQARRAPTKPQNAVPEIRQTKPQPQRAAVSSRRTYRTLCVRTCDGYYFPISFRVSDAKFRNDEAMCAQRCDGSEARLFVYRNPGQKLSSAVDLQGNRYRDLKNAFLYRKELVKGCSCDLENWGQPESGG